MSLLIYPLLITPRLSKFPRPLLLFDTDEREGLQCVLEDGSLCIKLHANLFDLGFDIMLWTFPAHSPPYNVLSLTSIHLSMPSGPISTKYRLSRANGMCHIKPNHTLIDPLSGSALWWKSFPGIGRRKQLQSSWLEGKLLRSTLFFILERRAVV